MKNFYEFSRMLSRKQAIENAESALQFLENSIQDLMNQRRQRKQGPLDGDKLTGTGKSGEAIHKRMTDRGRTSQVGENPYGISDPQWGTEYSTTASGTPDWDPRDHAVDNLDPKLKKELQIIGSLLNGLMRQEVEWDGKTINNWLSIDGNKAYDGYGNEVLKMTPDLARAFMLARKAGYVDFEDDDGNSLDSTSPPRNGVNIVNSQSRYIGGKKDLRNSNAEERQSAKKDSQLSPKSASHELQQRRKQKSLKPKTGPSAGLTRKLVDRLNKAMANFKDMKGFGVEANTVKAAQEVIDAASEILDKAGFIDPKIAEKVRESDIIKKMSDIVNKA